MQTPESQQIVGRFFEALNMLIDSKKIRGKQTFTKKYGINRWNLLTLEKDNSRDIFQVVWLSHMVKDFNISAEWLLTGKGGMYSKL